MGKRLSVFDRDHQAALLLQASKRRRYWLIAMNSCASLFVLVLGIWCSKARAQDLADVQNIITTLVTTTEERPRVESAISLLRLNATQPQKLKDLQAEPSVALLCQWHDLIDASGQLESEKKVPSELPKYLATRFAPIIKETLGVDAPLEWLQLISTGRVGNTPKELFFDVRKYETVCSVYHDTKVVPRVLLSDVEATDESFQTEIKGNDGDAGIDALVIPPTEVKEAIIGLTRYGNRWYTGAANQTHVFALIRASKFEWQQDLFCLERTPDTKHSKTTWKATLSSGWGNWVFPYPTGGMIGVTQIRLTKSNIYFFTGFYRAVSIVGMDLQTGKQSVVFSHLPNSVRTGAVFGKK